MAQYIKNAPILGRVGESLGRGLSEVIPKEAERYRLSQGLQNLGKQKNLSPFEQFAQLSSIPGITPQMIQSGSDLLRQQSIINSINQQRQQQQPTQQNPAFNNQPMRAGDISSENPASITTTQGQYSKQNPYIPPSGPDIEAIARQKMADEPLIYPNIESARQATQNEISGNVNKSNAQINAENLKEGIQTKAEDELTKNIQTLGANVPGNVIQKLQQKALQSVRSNELTPEAAGVKYSKEAEDISQSFSDIKSWGGMGLILNKTNDLINSFENLQKKAKKGGYQKEAADSMIADNKVTPKFAYASMYPVKDKPELNKFIKNLPSNSQQVAPGVVIRNGKATSIDPYKETMDMAPKLVELMGLDGSPLAIGYELDHKGYDSQAWKQYLTDHIDELNLSKDQEKELLKTEPGFYGGMNDWWFKSMSGVK